MPQGVLPLQPIEQFTTAVFEFTPNFVGKDALRSSNAQAIIFQPDAGPKIFQLKQQFSTTHISSSSNTSASRDTLLESLAAAVN
jgi:hypothetical protein